jgi:hypothetical protein
LQAIGSSEEPAEIQQAPQLYEQLQKGRLKQSKAARIL